MHGTSSAILIVTLLALFFIAMGLWERFSRRENPFGFWANVKTDSVRDVAGYNRALGRLWMGFGLYLLLLELPLFLIESALGAVLFILGMFFGALGLMLCYVLHIEPKYKR